jgi:segregation and condensation protein B
VEVGSGFRINVGADFAPWISRLWEERPPRYSRALMETLALIAYRQPITRGEIEDIRGVSVSSSIVKTLMEREWVREVGHRDVPGKPALLATTREFLNYFGLKSLDELPTLAEIKDLDSINCELELDVDQAEQQGADVQEMDKAGDEARESAEPATEAEQDGEEESLGTPEEASVTEIQPAAEEDTQPLERGMEREEEGTDVPHG